MHRNKPNITYLLSGLLHWHWGNHMIAPVPVKQPWNIWKYIAEIHKSILTTINNKTKKIHPYTYGTYYTLFWSVFSCLPPIAFSPYSLGMAYYNARMGSYSINLCLGLPLYCSDLWEILSAKLSSNLIELNSSVFKHFHGICVLKLILFSVLEYNFIPCITPQE